VTQLPQTDADVEIFISASYSADIGVSLLGIFRCRRAKGESVLEAWENTLLTHVGTVRKEENEVSKVAEQIRERDPAAPTISIPHVGEEPCSTKQP
jgi:hypothetical protein